MLPFERDQRRRGLAIRTINHRTRVLRAFERWLAPTALFDATTVDLDRWLDSCDLRSPRARSTYIGVLRAFYEWAARAGVATSNPAAELPLPRSNRLLPRPFPPDRLAAALAIAPPREYAALTLGAYAGLRCCEVARLHAEDVLIRDDPPAIFVREGKGGHQRVVPAHPETLAGLRRYGLPGHGHVFRLLDGRPVPEETLDTYLNRWLHRHGFSETFHQTRHYFGTVVYEESGHDLRMVQELMGHLDPASTAVYAAWNQARAAEIVNKLGTTAHPPTEERYRSDARRC